MTFVQSLLALRQPDLDLAAGDEIERPAGLAFMHDYSSVPDCLGAQELHDFGDLGGV